MTTDDLPYLAARVAALEALVTALLAERLVGGDTLRHAAIETLAQRKVAMDALANRALGTTVEMASGYITTLNQAAIALASDARA